MIKDRTGNQDFGLEIQVTPAGDRRFALTGHFGLHQIRQFEADYKAAPSPSSPSHTAFDLGGLAFLDSAGALALLGVAAEIKEQGGTCAFENVPPKIQGILDLINLDELTHGRPSVGRHTDFISQVGIGFLDFVADATKIISFLGEVIIDLAATCFNPRLVRWGDVILYVRRAGVEGLPIISLIALLLGLILAFMSSLQLKQFGANIYVASLLAIALVKELGPIMTAILVAGRSGSAFAAEIGTMKVNEEVDALTVMGMDPMYFLALPKVIASIIVVPLLTMYANLLGMIGGLIVAITLLDLTVYAYIQETRNALTVFDFTSSFVKTLVFAFVIAAIGCQRGFQVRGGAAAVGEATTSAVVASIFMIIVIDSVFAIVLTYLPR